MTASCANCHYQQLGLCTEPRNAQATVSLALGGDYQVRIVPPSIELTGVCDFHAEPMRNNYRSTVEEPKAT